MGHIVVHLTNIGMEVIVKTDLNPSKDIAAANTAKREAIKAKKKAKDAEKGIFETNNPCDYCILIDNDCNGCCNHKFFSGKRMRVMIHRN
jgi:hypothetical protein